MKIPKVSGGFWVAFYPIGFGHRIYILFEPTNGPIGFVWGIGFGKNQGGKRVFEVWGSYTPGSHRRRGVRSLINEEIFKSFEVIKTGIGSHSGIKFLKSQGFHVIKETGEWVKTKQKQR